jgi:hypothetical protein
MAMIDRYKKKGGFVQLLNVLETSGKDKQDKFLAVIAQESPNWEVELRKRILTLDKVLGWNPTYLAEIFPRIQPMFLAMIAGNLPPEKNELFMKVLTHREKKGVEDVLKEKKPTPAETSAGIMKLFAEIRKMEQEGTLKFDKFAPDMTIPDNFEESLGKGGGGSMAMPSSSGSGPALAAVSSAPPPAGTPAEVAEEISALRRKIVQMNGELQKLMHDNHSMKEKLDQIRKIA